jgi:hypothetical protein
MKRFDAVFENHQLGSLVAQALDFRRLERGSLAVQACNDAGFHGFVAMGWEWMVGVHEGIEGWESWLMTSIDCELASSLRTFDPQAVE